MSNTEKLLNDCARSAVQAAEVCAQYSESMLGMYGWRLAHLQRRSLVPGRLIDYCAHLKYCVCIAHSLHFGRKAPIEASLEVLPQVIDDDRIEIAREELPGALQMDLFEGLRIARGPQEWPGFLLDACDHARVGWQDSAVIAAAWSEMLRASLQYLLIDQEIDWSSRPGKRLAALLSSVVDVCSESLLLLHEGRELYPDAAFALVGEVCKKVEQASRELPLYMGVLEQLGNPRDVAGRLGVALRDLQFWYSWPGPLHRNCALVNALLGDDGSEFCDWV